MKSARVARGDDAVDLLTRDEREGLVGEDAGDLLLGDEGRGDGVGGWQRTKNDSVKSVKEIR